MDWNDEAALLDFSRKSKHTSNNESSITKPEHPPEFNPINKKGGWAEEGTKLKSKSKTQSIEQEHFKEQRTEDSDDDIPVIPDLEDLQDEPILTKSFKEQMPAISDLTYKELDFELSVEGSYPLSKATLKTKKGDISLALLTKYLHSEKEVKETDVIWTMESLWNEISSDK